MSKVLSLKCLMLFLCLFGVAIGIGIEHAGIILLFDFDSDFDPD
jgi:uncharacterized membrane protein